MESRQLGSYFLAGGQEIGCLGTRRAQLASSSRRRPLPGADNDEAPLELKERGFMSGCSFVATTMPFAFLVQVWQSGS